jgi:tight adherence protein B
MRIAAAAALLAALALPAASLGQSGQKASQAKAKAKKAQAQKAAQQQQLAQQAPTLSQSTSVFPDKIFLLALPKKQELKTGDVHVTENGGPVENLGVTPPGGSKNGVVLLIDASDSMKGTPIKQAMAAAKSFLSVRKDDLPVAVVVFGPDETVLSDFTTNPQQLADAVSQTPVTAEGTHIYDALQKASDLAKGQGYERTTVVLLSDGTDQGSSVTRDEALKNASDDNVRVIAVGLNSRQFSPAELKGIAAQTGGAYVPAASPAALTGIFNELGQKLSNEYEVSYTSLLPPQRPAVVAVAVTGYPTAKAKYTTPSLDLAPRGTFAQSRFDTIITSPWLMLFVVVSVLALLAFAFLSALDVRKRSLRRRMAQYVTVPTEEESRLRRAEVSAMLADRAQKTVGEQRWWQRFESDVELGGFKLSPLAIAGWTIVAGIAASLVTAVVTQNMWWLLLGLGAPFVTRAIVRRRVRKRRADFSEQLPDNLDVLAGAMRTGHSTMGALSVMVDSADEPSKSEFRRVVQDEQLGVPLDDALMVMARRMDSYDAEQIALVMRLQREAGGNTAEVLDRVAEVIRGRAARGTPTPREAGT